MLTRKTKLRRPKHLWVTPFMRFFPEGSDIDADDVQSPSDDSKAADTDAIDDAIKDSEPAVEDTPQFKGLLRDRQADRAALSQANAELAVIRAQSEEMKKTIEELKKSKDEPLQLSEEEAFEPVTRGELLKTLKSTLDNHFKKVAENVNNVLETRELQGKNLNLKKNQAADAQALMRTNTIKTKGLGLDAKSVVNEAVQYLANTDPEYLEFLSKQPDYASRIYKLATGEPLIPTIGQRVEIRRNAILAQKLDQKGNEPKGGGAPSGDDLSIFEAIMSSGGQMSDDNLDKMFSEEI